MTTAGARLPATEASRATASAVAIAIAAGLNYQQVCDDLNRWGTLERRSRLRSQKSSARDGIYISTQCRYLRSLGWVWIPTMFIGSGCKVHLRADELPSGWLFVSLSKHLTAVIDGVIHDTEDPSRNGMRYVYGYYLEPVTAAVATATSVGARTQ